MVPFKPIAIGAVDRVAQEALIAADGDDRSAMAILQAAYLQLACRLAIAEEGPGPQRTRTVRSFCSGASEMIARYQVQVDDVQTEGHKFATQLRSRFETEALTATRSDEYVDAFDADPPAETY